MGLRNLHILSHHPKSHLSGLWINWVFGSHLGTEPEPQNPNSPLKSHSVNWALDSRVARRRVSTLPVLTLHNSRLMCSVLIMCLGHTEDRSLQMSNKTSPSTPFPHLPVGVQAVSGTAEACRVHGWRLTVNTHREPLSQVLHPSRQRAVFPGAVVSQ